MFLIIAVILISISGILCLLLFSGNPKPHETNHPPNLDEVYSTVESISHNSREEIQIVFDEPTDMLLLDINIDTPQILSTPNIREKTEVEIILQNNNKSALTTNSKINPFNF